MEVIMLQQLMILCYGTDNGTNNDVNLTIANGSTTTFTGNATTTDDDDVAVGTHAAIQKPKNYSREKKLGRFITIATTF